MRPCRQHILSAAGRDSEPSPRRLPAPGAHWGHLPPGYTRAEREALPGHQWSYPDVNPGDHRARARMFPWLEPRLDEAGFPGAGRKTSPGTSDVCGDGGQQTVASYLHGRIHMSPSIKVQRIQYRHEAGREDAQQL